METPSTFKIVEPCHENWNSMTAESQGRFCASCQRCVIDFSNKSRTEMKEIYDREGGDVCGRVKVSQLVSPRPAVRATFSLRRNGLKSLQLFALALMAAFTLMFSSPAKAQDGPRMVMGKMEYVAPTARLEGKVTWDSGESASGVTVRISQNGTLVATTMTDDQGRFSFAQRHGGEYTVAVEAGHGTRATETIELKEHKTREVKLVLHDTIIMGGISFDENERIYEPVQPVEPKQPEPKEPLRRVERPFAPVDTASTLLAADEAITLDGFEVTVFPNPTDDHVTLQVRKAGTQSLNATLMDGAGKVIQTTVLEAEAGNERLIDLSELPAGIYFLRMDAGEDHAERRIVKR